MLKQRQTFYADDNALYDVRPILQSSKVSTHLTPVLQGKKKDKVVVKRAKVGLAFSGAKALCLFEKGYEVIVLHLPWTDISVAHVVASLRYLEKELKRPQPCTLIVLQPPHAGTELPLHGIDAVYSLCVQPRSAG